MLILMFTEYGCLWILTEYVEVIYRYGLQCSVCLELTILHWRFLVETNEISFRRRSAGQAEVQMRSMSSSSGCRRASTVMAGSLSLSPSLCLSAGLSRFSTGLGVLQCPVACLPCPVSCLSQPLSPTMQLIHHCRPVLCIKVISIACFCRVFSSVL